LATKTNGSENTTAIATPLKSPSRAPFASHFQAASAATGSSERLPVAIGGHEAIDARERTRHEEPCLRDRRLPVAAELAEHVRSPGNESGGERDRTGDERDVDARQRRIGDLPSQEVQHDNSRQQHDAVFLDQEGRNGEYEQRQPPARRARADGIPPDERREHDQDLQQVHLIRNPGDERVGHDRVRDEERDGERHRDRALEQPEREPCEERRRQREHDK
jgi:hypothetical protein